MIKKGNDFMSKKFFFWLDDERPIPDSFYRLKNVGFEVFHCSNYESIKGWLEELSVFDPEAHIYISFDHDLGEGKTGYDVAKYIVENSINLKCYWIHSMNPAGVKNIYELLDHYGFTRKYFWI